MAASTPSDITCLPIEIIEMILGDMNISVKDVVYLSMTCKAYNSMINGNNIIWSCKFFQRWPSLIDVCKAEWSYGQINVRKEFIERMKCRKELCNYFSVLNEKYRLRRDLSSSDIRDFDSMFRDEKGIYSMKFYYLQDDLTNMLNDLHSCNPRLHSNWDCDINLTHIHYAKIVLLYMKQRRLKDEWFNFITLPSGQQVLEKALAIAHQFLLLHKIESVPNMLAQLNSIVDEICELLKKKSLFSKSTAQLNFWKHNNIENCHWEDPEKTKEMLRVIHHILYWKIGNRMYLYERWKIENTLYYTVIFHAVVRRFGIRCDVVISDEDYQCLDFIWGENYNATSSKYKRINSLLIYSSEFKFRKISYLCDKKLYFSLENLKDHIMTPTQLMKSCYKKMKECLAEIADDYIYLELNHMLDPRNEDTLLDLGKSLAMYRRMDHSDVIAILNTALADVNTSSPTKTKIIEILQMVESRQLPEPPNEKVYRRAPAIRYAIGMVVHLRNMGYEDENEDEFVIRGWKLYPCAQSSERQAASLLYEPSENVILPHYRVYYKLINVKTSLSICVSQDDVIPVMTDIHKFNLWTMLRSDIGRFFTYFKGTHFIPSPVLEKMYPDDAIVREQWVSRINAIANQGA